MANRKVLFRSAASLNEVSPSADSILIASIDQGATTFTLKTSGTTLYSVATSGLMTMNGNFSIVPATDDTGTLGVDPALTGGDPLGVGVERRFSVVRARRIKSGSSVLLENSIDITNSADGVAPANTGRIKYESGSQALRASENGGALDDFVLRTKAQTLTNKTFTAPSISDFTSSQHSHQNAAGGGQLDHGLALTGLTDDDHTQYALLVGRAGGQLLRGGTAAGEDLQLQSTSHSTRGRVIAVDQLATSTTATKAALQIGSLAGDPSSLADGDVWFNSTTVRFRARENGVSKNLIGGRTALWGEFDFDTDTTATDPGTGDVKFNNAAPASVTAIYISQTTDAGFDAENFLDALATGDVIYIQDEDNATKFWRGTVSGALTDNGAWWTIPVTYVDSGAGGLFANNDNLLVALLFAGASSGGTLQQAYDAAATITTDASGDVLFTRGASAVAGDELLHLVDANASISRTAALFFVEDANAGSGVTCRFVRTAGTDGVALIEGNSARTVAIRNQSGNTDAVVVDTVNARLGINRIAGVAAFVPAFDIHYQSQAGNGSIVIDLYSDNGGENFEIIGRKARGTVGVPAALTDDDDMFELGCYGHNGTTWSPQAASILFEAAGTWSGTNNGTRQIFKTTLNGATTLREVMVLGDDGCVVITNGTNGFIGAVNGENLRVVGGARFQTFADFVETTLPATPAANSMRLFGVDENGFTRLKWVSDAGVVQTLTQDEFVTVRNTSGATIPKGRAVYVTGVTTGVLNVSPAQANAIGTMVCIGVAAASIADTAIGLVLTAGLLENFDTSALTAGASVYVSASTAGVLTSTAPIHPNLTQRVGYCRVSNAATGSIDFLCPPQTDGISTGTNLNFFAIGDGTAGAKTLSFVAAGAGVVTWTPTTARTVTIPDATGTVVLSTTLAATGFVQNGNSFGALATIGTNDAFDLAFEVAGVEQVRLLNADGALLVNRTTHHGPAGFQPLFEVDNPAAAANSKVAGFYNTGGGAGTELDILFSTFTGWTVSAPATLRVSDNSFSCDFSFRSKLQGGAANADAERFRIMADNTVRAGVDATSSLGTSAIRWLTVIANTHQVFAAASDANPSAYISSNSIQLGAGGGTALDVQVTRGAADRMDLASGDSLNIVLGNFQMAATTVFESDRDVAITLIANADASLSLGSSARRWSTIIGNGHLVYAAASDAQPSVNISTNSIQLGPGGATAVDVQVSRGAANRFDLATGDSFNLVSGDLLFGAVVLFEADRDLAVTLLPNADGTLNVGSSARRFSTIIGNTHQVFAAASDANPTVSITTQSITMGVGGGTAVDVRMRRTAANTFTFDNGSTGAATIVPATTNTGVIGTDALKWNRIRATSVVTGDLEMKDESKGVHYVLVEEKDGIYVRDMVKKKMYKIPMVEVPWRN